jgi:ferric-dicitrate binding protein FerR (iron transport regulator)
MDECRRVHELWDRETTGETLDEACRASIRSHLEHCPECRLEAEVVAALDLDGPDGPPPLADDLSRRRLVDAVIDGADRRGSKVRGKRFLAAAGIGAAAAAAAIAVVLISAAGEDRPAPATPAAIATGAPAVLEGRVLLVSAGSEAGGASLDRVFSAGDPLPATGDLTVIGLGTGIRVALHHGAESRVVRLDEREATLEVAGGTLVAWVDPDREGPRFSIATRAGTIEVAGTVFRLDVAGDRAEVGVLRGRVTLREPDSAPRHVDIGETAVLGTGSRGSLRPEAREDAGRTLALLDLLAPKREARVEIRSLPAGAAVTLDDVVLGATPLCASIRPGHRAIALDLPGHAPVREILEVARGDLVSRVFELPAGPPADASAAEPRAGTSRPAAGPGPAELLAEAQALRAARDWAGAVAAYDTVVRRHGTSAEARSASISSATIRLDHLRDPRGALGLFDGYLARHASGALAQEAAWGRCRALRALHRTADERQALASFVAAYPAALEADAARARLREIEK